MKTFFLVEHIILMNEQSISFLLEGGTFKVYTSSYAYIHKSKFIYFQVIFSTVLPYFKNSYADILYLSLWCIHSKHYYSLSNGNWGYADRYVLYTMQIILVFLWYFSFNSYISRGRHSPTWKVIIYRLFYITEEKNYIFFTTNSFFLCILF